VVEPSSPDLSVIGDFKGEEMTAQLEGFMGSEAMEPEDMTKPVFPRSELLWSSND
jgi:hypothetical protein